MTIQPTPVDVLANRPFEEGRYQGAFWWGLPSHKVGREASVENLAPIEKRLATQDWSEPTSSERKKGQAITAWRGAWATAEHGLLLSLIQRDLGPPNDCLQWWPSSYFRNKALGAIFLPNRGETEEQKAARKTLAQEIETRWPKVVEFFLRSYSVKSLYAHPLVITARPGMEDEHAFFSSVVGYDVLFSGENALTQPGELLLLGLRRRFEPFISAALEAGATADSRVLDFNGNERSLIHAAVGSADQASVDWLLAQGASLEVWDKRARTPFLQAARMGDTVALEKLAAAGADVNATDRFGQTALHLVIEGISGEKLDIFSLKNYGHRNYLPKEPEEISESVERAAQAFLLLLKLGVNKDATVLPKPTKKADSAFAHLPRSNRSKFSGQPGETWGDYLNRRIAAETFFPPETASLFFKGSLENAWGRLIAPEPEEVSSDLDLSRPMPAPSRRPRF